MMTSNLDTFTEESTKFGNCDIVLRKMKKSKTFSGLSPGGLKGQWYENGKRKVESKRRQTENKLSFRFADSEDM